MQTWIWYTGASVAGIALGGFILYQTNWFRIRKYAIDVKRVFDKHDVQKKAEAVQNLGQNPNPVLRQKPLRELITSYQGLIAGLEKVKAPKKAAEVHEETLTMHRESMSLYQMLLTGKASPKAMQDKQRKLQKMEVALQAKMEALYGPMKKAKK